MTADNVVSESRSVRVQLSHVILRQGDNDMTTKRKLVKPVQYEFLWIRTMCDYIHLNAFHCVLFSSRVTVRITCSVWLVSSYAHVLLLFSVVIVTLPDLATCRSPFVTDLSDLRLCYNVLQAARHGSYYQSGPFLKSSIGSQLKWRLRFKTATLTRRANHTGSPPYLANFLQHRRPARPISS